MANAVATVREGRGGTLRRRIERPDAVRARFRLGPRATLGECGRLWLSAGSGARRLRSDVSTKEDAMHEIDGGCACGGIRYRLASKPMFVHCCHCRECQRQTGSAFVVNALIETDRVERLAGETEGIPVPDRQRDGRTSSIAAPPARWPSGATTAAPAAELHPRRSARRPRGAAAGRPHLHTLEAALGLASRRGSGGRGLLQGEGAVASGKPRPAQGAVRVRAVKRPTLLAATLALWRSVRVRSPRRRGRGPRQHADGHAPHVRRLPRAEAGRRRARG